MSNNVFWGAVGAVLVVWLVLLGVIYAVKYVPYQEQADELKGRMRLVKSFGELAEQGKPFPTPERLAYHESYNSSLGRNNDATAEWYSSRDERFEDAGGRENLADWVASYNDAFRDLERRYRENAGIDASQKIPFTQIKDLTAASSLAEYKRRWSIQRTIVEQTLQHGGTVASYRFVNRPDPKKSLGHPDFKGVQVEVEVNVPPEQSQGFVNALLTDPAVNFDFSELIMAKDRRELQYDLVQEVSKESGEMPKSEPAMRLHMYLEVQDWDPQPPEESEG